MDHYPIKILCPIHMAYSTIIHYSILLSQSYESHNYPLSMGYVYSISGIMHNWLNPIDILDFPTISHS